MRRTQVLWEAYVTHFEDALDRYKQGRLTIGNSIGQAGPLRRQARPPAGGRIRAGSA